MITLHPFGTLPDGRAVTRYRLENQQGAYADILDYGGVIQTLCVPDRNGALVDVSLGYDDLAGYLQGNAHLGASLGRYANRICGASFPLLGKTISVTPNEGDKCLHGGPQGFDRYLWAAQVRGDTLALRRTSPDGEAGFPGNLQAEVTYTLLPDNSLRITYQAETDMPTVVNLSNHCYFNLAGQGNGQILDHTLTILGDAYTETDDTMHTTGRILPVKDTPLDFTAPKPIGRDIGHASLAATKGFDHNYVLPGQGRRLVARAYCPRTGIGMDVLTDQPGVQLYTGNFLKETGKGGVAYGQYDAFCLETQNYPDAPNHPNFPSALLLPGIPYVRETVYAFTRAD